MEKKIPRINEVTVPVENIIENIIEIDESEVKNYPGAKILPTKVNYIYRNSST